MKKALALLFVISAFSMNAQKNTADVKDADKNTLIIKETYEAYSNNDHSLWDEILADDAKVYLNNTLLDGKTVKEGFKFHHTIFNYIRVTEVYAHTTYFKEGDVWTNSWFTWMGTGNKTGIGFSNRCHFDMKWENGKIVEMLCYYDNTSLNMEMAAQ